MEEREEDWLNAGTSAELELVRAVAERNYMLLPDGDRSTNEEAQGVEQWTRRPNVKEISATVAIDSAVKILPSIDIFDRLSCPMVAVLPAEGFYAARRSELVAVSDADPRRELVDVTGGHNTVMASPDTVSGLVSNLLKL